MTKFKIGDIVKGQDGEAFVFGYVLEYTGSKQPSVMVCWFDGHGDTDSLCRLLRRVTNLEELDRIEDW